MSKKKIVLTAIAILVIALVVVTVQNMNGNGDEAVEVQTDTVKRQKVVQTVNATGRIQPKTQVKVSADVSAKITHLNVKEGDWVEKGDFLLELDRENHLAAVESAQASLNSTESDAKLARENMTKAEKDYLRAKELFEKNLESQSSLEAYAAAFQVEKARYESALDQVDRAAAYLKQMNDNLSKTRIYAPMAGTISRLNKEVGEIALGSQFQEDVIMVISNLSGMEALVDVDENDVVSVSAGDSAKIEVDAFPDVVFDGIVTEIANRANISGQGTADQKTEFEVKVAVLQSFDSGQKTVPAGGQEINTANVNNRLRPGMTAGCDIVTEIRENALSIPIQSVAVRTVEQLTPAKPVGKNDAIADEQPEESAYKPDKDGFVEVVFVVKSDGTVEARQVKTGIQSDTHIEILEGLSENDQIVIGNYRAISKDLQNGTPVTVKDNTAAK